MNGPDAILVENVVKRYPIIGGFRDLVRHPLRRPVRTALDGVSLRVGRGRAFCLLGPNGAGKTTLIKILTTLVLPDAGRVFVDGQDVVRAPAAVKQAVGFAINDERSFYWRLTGRQNLEFFGALDGLRGRRRDDAIAGVLGLTGLEAAADLRFNAYSTGMRQMLAVARALLADADILFVDEPTRSLDPRAAARVRKFLRRELVDIRKKTVFWATHDLGEAGEFGHDVAIIDSGRIRAQGPIERLTEGGRLSLRDVYEKSVAHSEAPAPAAAGEVGR
ncbi:MAG TPA: ABC transporter ATP-binding protein [Burkholderiales bacterium]|nr:ABC transporter ATP-binding protein [Burkholderiales bacterium]